MVKRKGGKIRTNILVDCPCGAKGAVYDIGGCRWFVHCAGCGRIIFISSAQVFERIKLGGALCPHHVEFAKCKDGVSLTSWCSTCRVRTFITPT